MFTLIGIVGTALVSTYVLYIVLGNLFGEYKEIDDNYGLTWVLWGKFTE